MSPAKRIAGWCVLGFLLAIPWTTVNLIVRMPNQILVILAGGFVALGVAWFAIGALRRRVRAEWQSADKLKERIDENAQRK